MLPYIKKPLSYSFSDTAFLLQQLQDLTGLVYLRDQNLPVIAFLPSNYVIIDHHQEHFFLRQGTDRYIEENNTTFPIKPFSSSQRTSNTDHQHGFQSGYIGFISYDYAAEQFISKTSKPQPTFFLGHYLSFLKLENGQWYYYGFEEESNDIFIKISALIQETPKPTFLHLYKKFRPRWQKNLYTNAFSQVQNYILAGDCYQINLTQEFQAQAKGALLYHAAKLWQLTNAPYAGYLKIKDFELLSCSPELFIEFNANGSLRTRPIKGTMPRSKDPKKDLQSKSQLMASEKDKAENLMIVDLLRNDLSVYAEIGSVKTTQLFEIESFNQVHHMVSEITAQLKKDVHPFDMLLSALPGGSITGAPKIRAMEIIEELEGSPRGAYCGTLGYFNHDGSGRWNILIRSIQKNGDDLSLWAGGGITISSQIDAEYQECFDKVSAMLDLLNA